ncbi:SDR family oxidoreductase [Desertifilum sp. FACHB-1129]|uniref:dTDP-4-dehydrorhamnose reductase n=1 Tax=Desertifilum tharense IPPAS B-1220 TaxID=1781255 RepID=A0A1E5QRB2_9CYAN|nr:MULTISPECIES: family 1 glycosylhydrolase [Desertifilum]MDA0212138.1 sugar nucleotide-binding protein [Cyanobacteria bacterium FC1]MBD2313194.1 SDR family oxidoreductase [Desertifilum sp. FACHB-1129]MBD2323543.1 SDR family oxidoreductase [Desertifilum sp. FACHB-866]MBD2334096.1 SDR family oxidoreductase [Desertifilum sp. FACHB-868]OEJ77171.1 dTDP-4-dehydrorhamnose reductase [Desertifilum tharense IPPAS B-1220]
MTRAIAIPALEVWAGVECTVNRVGDQYFDQLERNGHAERLDDLDRFAQLGIRAIRYPILWERTAPNERNQIDWTWADERLGRLRELGIRPIVGLVHHGSGPRHTSLIDPAFPEKLAEFAQAVAERYPWVDSYTPVNEPLTTARFSGLYGYWYPHGRDGLTFARALLIQCRAIVLAMQAIRQVNPTAQLVQTEDLGKTYSTPLLAYQAAFENERRWLSFDLLCGRLNASSALWSYLTYLGIEEAELKWFEEHPCPPNLLGINHYLTSERFLDERLDRYPVESHGENGKHRYADIEAVRVCAEGTVGSRTLLKETWERYKLPLAVTEVHLGCTREEQLRWLKEVWDGAVSARREGVDVRAVTAWSLLGAYDWNSLVTRAEGYYESGAFDLRSPYPRPTALARMVKDLATQQESDHPVLDTLGWWHRPERLLYPSVSCPNDFGRQTKTKSQSARLLAIIGARGTLGKAFARLCDLRGIAYRLLTRGEMDITNAASVDAALDELQPWAVVNAAGYVRVDDAEREPDLCLRVNAEGPAILAESCARRGVGLLTFSSDLVFDGSGTSPYVESHAVAPLNVYGRSKALAEARVLKAYPASLAIRTSAFFGPWDEYNFVAIALRQLGAGGRFVAAEDAVVSPTYVPDLVNASLDLLMDGECGLWHLANSGAIAWAELARLVAVRAGFDASRIEACSTQELGLAAVRPTYSVLGSERGVLLPCLDRAISRYFDERQQV